VKARLWQGQEDELRTAADSAGVGHVDLSMVSTYVVSYLLIPELNHDKALWWKLSTIITCGTLAGALIPEMIKIFTSTKSAHVKEVVTASREGDRRSTCSRPGGRQLLCLWMGMVIVP